MIVDEAHAAGLMGPNGTGLVAEKSMSEFVFARVITFGKALGTHGAIVVGSRLLKDYLINFSRPFIYTTALPLVSLAAIKCAYRFLPQLGEERAHLRELVEHFRTEYGKGSETAIQSIKIKGNKEVRAVSQEFVERGFDVRAIMCPTVRRGDECLRISLHAHNRLEEVKSLLAAFNDRGLLC